MANRIVDVVYRLRDLFTGQVGKITGGYRQMGDEAERAASRTERAFRKTGSVIDTVAGGFSRLAAALGVSFGAGAAAREFSRFVDDADRLGKTAQKLGFAVEELQRVGYAAELNGVNFQTMAVAIQRATRRIAEVASTGKGEAAPALDALGVSAEQLTRLGLEDRMAVLADAFANVSDQGERVRLAFKLFDTEGVDMVRVLQDGSAAFRELTQEAERAGRVLDKEATEAAERLNDAMSRVAAAKDRAFARFAAPIAEELAEFADNVGLGGDRLQYLRTQLILAEGELADIERNPTDFWNLYGDGVVEASQRVSDLRREIAALSAEDRRAADQQDQRQKQLREQQLINADVAAALEQEQAHYKANQLSKQKTLEQETAQLRAAKQQQAAIVREFDALADELAGQQRDANIIDAAYLQRQAQASLEAGRVDEAIEKARAAGDMLRDLKAAGEDGIELGYLAKQLQQIAQAATQARVDQELIDVQQATRDVDSIKAKLAELNNTTVTVNIQPRVVGGGALNDTIADALTKKGRK